MVNLAVRCVYVFVYNLKSGGENGEFHYCFIWKGFLENILKWLFFFPLKWDHALFMCFPTRTLGQIRNTGCCAVSSIWDTLISKWLPGRLLVHTSTANNCCSVQTEGSWTCTTKARLVAVRSSPAAFVKNVKNNQVRKTSQGKSVVCLVSCNCTAFIFFQKCTNLLS